MKKLFFAVVLFTGCSLSCIAQSDGSAGGAKKERITDQYIGVQLNGLIRQVFNFNNNTASTVVNPYLLNYNINYRKTGWGLRLGIGGNINNSWSNDGITETTTDNTNLQFRVGIEKAYRLGDKWSAGIGLDILTVQNNDKTTGIVRSSDTVTTVTKTLLSTFGGGAMGWLRYNITGRITIGTESSLYYTNGVQTSDIATTRRVRVGITTQVTTSETKSKPTVSQASVTLPIAFYLAVKF